MAIIHHKNPMKNPLVKAISIATLAVAVSASGLNAEIAPAYAKGDLSHHHG